MMIKERKRSSFCISHKKMKLILCIIIRCQIGNNEEKRSYIDIYIYIKCYLYWRGRFFYVHILREITILILHFMRKEEYI